MDAHGRSWTLMEAHGSSRTVMDGHGRSSTVIDAHGSSWKLMDGHGRSFWVDAKVTLGGREDHAGWTLVGCDSHAGWTRRSRSRFRIIRTTVFILKFDQPLSSLGLYASRSKRTVNFPYCYFIRNLLILKSLFRINSILLD